MDYKYIEQLLVRYWNGESTLEEEDMLRTFFRQEDIPAQLARYRDLFTYEALAKKDVMPGDDFDARLLAKVECPTVKARRLSWNYQLRPFCKAAAVVAIILTLGTAIRHSIQGESNTVATDYDYATYSDTYSDPQVAFDEVSSALQLVADGLRATLPTDSLNPDPSTTGIKMTE